MNVAILSGLSAALVLAMAATVSGETAAVAIRPLVEPAVPQDAPTLPLVQEADNSWFAGKPLWQAQGNGVAARLWAATTRQKVLVRIEVDDPDQSNTYSERNLWRGDCVYVGIDGRGDIDHAAGDAWGQDDAVYLCGLGADGAEARVARHGDPSLAEGNRTDLIRSITRDEPKKLTVYSLAIPWAQLNSAFGQSAAIGLAATIAHKDADGKDLAWGRPTATKDARRQYTVCQLTHGEAGIATVAPRVTRVWNAGQQVSAVIAYRGERGASVTATLASHSATVQVPAAPGIRRFEVTAPFAITGPGADKLVISVEGAAGALADAQFPLSSPAISLDGLEKRAELLLKTCPNAIVRDHLLSTRAILREAVTRLDWQADNIEPRANELMTTMEMILRKLPADRFDWLDHIGRGLPLVLAFVSETDQTLQYFNLQMPFGYEETKSYPLTVYLHGAGSDNPLVYLGTAFDNSHQDTLFKTAKIDPSNVPPTHQGFVLAPWARGNSLYRGAGESDVWQSIEVVRKRFKIDPDRMYMSGFSMGCNGAYGLAARSPDLWAGINLSAGFGSWSDTNLEYLDENVRGIPIVGWIGELDGMVEDGKAFRDRLKAKGIDLSFTVLPKTPHTYPYDEYQKCMGELMKHRRPARPGTFSLVADKQRHGGRNGVTMAVARPVDPKNLPAFTCGVEGQTVTIDSKNTSGLEVRLGEGGLGLTGPVKVIWNGKTAYEGEAKTVELGDKIGWFSLSE